MENFLLGSGFAVIIALLSWSDRIKDLQRETHEIESEFAKERKTTLRKIRAIFSQQQEISLLERIDLLTSLFKRSSPETEIKITVEVVTSFQKLAKMWEKLENYLQWKFKLVVYIGYYLIISGSIAFFIPNQNHINLFGKQLLFDFLFVIPLILFSLFLLSFLLFINGKESAYRKELTETMEKF